MSKSKWEVMVGERGVYLNGEKLRKIGEGITREVYASNKQSLVVKVSLDGGDCSIIEHQVYKKSRGKLRSMLAPVYKSGEIRGVTYCVQKYIKGKVLGQLKTRWKKYGQDYDYLEERIDDFHDENVVVCKETKKLFCIDMGYGRI